MTYLDVFLSVMAIIIMVLTIGWILSKRDESDERTEVDKMKIVLYKRQPSFQKIKILTNKLTELQRSPLAPDVAKIKITHKRLQELKNIQLKSELMYQEELMQCQTAMSWLEESEEHRERCGPPDITEAFAPLTELDMEKVAALTSAPIDLRPDAFDQITQRAVGSGEDQRSSIPVVDAWLMEMFMSLREYLDMAWDVVEALRDMLSTLIDATDFKKLMKDLSDFLLRTVVVNTHVDLERNKTTLTADFWVPYGVPLGDAPPEAVPTGPSKKPFSKLCCTPVKYTEPKGADEAAKKPNIFVRLWNRLFRKKKPEPTSTVSDTSTQVSAPLD